jgi:hypothetical protein
MIASIIAIGLSRTVQIARLPFGWDEEEFGRRVRGAVERLSATTGMNLTSDMGLRARLGTGVGARLGIGMDSGVERATGTRIHTQGGAEWEKEMLSGVESFRLGGGVRVRGRVQKRIGYVDCLSLGDARFVSIDSVLFCHFSSLFFNSCVDPPSPDLGPNIPSFPHLIRTRSFRWV